MRCTSRHSCEDWASTSREISAIRGGRTIPAASLNESAFVMKYYLIHPFHLHQIGDQWMVTTTTSVIRLLNNSIRCLLARLDTLEGPYLPVSVFAQYVTELELPLTETLEFLFSNGLIRDAGCLNDHFNYVTVVAPQLEDASSLANKLIADVPNLSWCDLSVLRAQPLGKDEPQLWVLLLERYSDSHIRAFYKSLRERGGAVAGLVAYVRLHTLCVSSLYYPSQGTPCHFCHIGWEERARSSVRTQASSISSLMRSFEASGHSEMPITTLSESELQVAQAYIANVIKQFCGVSIHRILQDEVTVRREFDLSTFYQASHVAAHWPGCDCQYVTKEAA